MTEKHDRRRDFRGQRLQAVFLFLALQAVIIASLLLFRQQEETNLLRERQQDLEQQFRASALTYRRLAQFVFASTFDRPETTDLLARAATADAKTRARLRTRLDQEIRPVYDSLVRAGFRQVHFHLPDGTSLLRLHLPGVFGDDLLRVRPSVARMIREQRFLEGFEVGRHWHAYRFLFPLHLEGRFVGSVELSLPLSTLLANLMDTFPSQVRFVVHRTLATAHLDADYLQRHYRASPFGPEFLVERSDQETAAPSRPEGLHLTEAAALILDHHLIPHLADLDQPVSVDHRIDGATLLSTLIPIRDISGARGGILIFDERFPYLDTLRARYLLGWLVVTGFLLLLLVLHDRYTRDLRASHAELDQVFDSAADGIRILDNQGRIVKANATFGRMAGLKMEQIIGRPCHSILGGDTCNSDQCPQRLIASGRDLVREEAVKTRPDGSHLTCLVEARPFYDGSGNRIGIIEDFRDITPRKELERQLHEMALTDPLTGLRNRRGFLETAEQQLRCIHRSGSRGFLLFADLDNMKGINDTLGHAAGDRTLRRTAGLLRSTFREADVVARMGGDEFAVLMGTNPEMDSEQAILARFTDRLDRLNDTLPPAERISVSLGLVRAGKGIDLEELLRRADRKMYAVKKEKKGQAKTSARTNAPSNR